MAKLIFTTKVNPTYDDLPEERYHFPRTYLNTARQAIGDWALYYEPRRSTGDDSSRGGRQVYFATARIREIVPDPQRPDDHHYALMADYLEFPQPVPFRDGAYYAESALQKEDGSVNRGQFGRAVRIIPDVEYMTILQRGFSDDLFAAAGVSEADALLVAEPEADYGRPTVQRLVNQHLRDAAFAALVRQAYDSTCAMTGIKLVNGGGRCEIEAAHIRPVASHGPDSPRNGLALSRTCHWMFDRGILSIEDDGGILTAGALVPEPVKRMLNPEGRIRLPENRIWQPHRQFLRWHRENVFKG